MRPQRALGATGGISRRTTLGALLAASLVGAAPEVEGEPLKLIAARRGLRFGSALRAASLGEPDLVALTGAQCSSLTPELEMKWAAMAPTPDRTDWTGADAIVAFARARDMAVRGHALLWHRSVPRWFTAATPWSVVGDHIRATVTRYRDAVDEWDVVNEPIAPDGGGLRASPLLAAYGAGHIARALREARDAAPHARLMLNEYDLEYDLPVQAARRRALLALVRALRAEGAPLDGIGIQAHLTVGHPFSAAVFAAFLDALAQEGLAISITEFDVRERDYVLPPDRRDAAVAEHAAPVLATALACSAVRSLTSWGLSDRQSWLEVTAADRARFPGAWRDGSSPGLNRGLPFDGSCRPKPLRDTLARVLAAPPG